MKKDSLIIFNLKEKPDGDVQQELQSDTEAYRSVCDKIDVKTHEIQSIFRIDKVAPDKNRPLIVKIASNTKSEI